MMNNSLCILATGGTIDKEHCPTTEKLVFTDKSYLPEMLEQCRAPAIPHEVIMLKDSFDITLQDRAIIKDTILSRAESRIVITHGTSTMSETASYLKQHIQDKVVVLTGAMRPFSLFKSDAGFNLGSAITAAKLLPHGIYIAMNGTIFNANQVRKNIEKGIFEAL